MGDFEAPLPGGVESPVRYHPLLWLSLTRIGKTMQGQYLADSLSGALPSQKVTEGSKGTLGADGNRADSVMA